MSNINIKSVRSW